MNFTCIDKTRRIFPNLIAETFQMNVVHSCFTLALIYGLLDTSMRYDLFSHKGNDFRISLCQGIDLCLLQQSLQLAYQSGRSLDCCRSVFF